VKQIALVRGRQIQTTPNPSRSEPAKTEPHVRSGLATSSPSTGAPQTSGPATRGGPVPHTAKSGAWSWVGHAKEPCCRLGRRTPCRQAGERRSRVAPSEDGGARPRPPCSETRGRRHRARIQRRFAVRNLEARALSAAWWEEENLPRGSRGRQRGRAGARHRGASLSAGRRRLMLSTLLDILKSAWSTKCGAKRSSHTEVVTEKKCRPPISSDCTEIASAPLWNGILLTEPYYDMCS